MRVLGELFMAAVIFLGPCLLATFNVTRKDPEA